MNESQRQGLSQSVYHSGTKFRFYLKKKTSQMKFLPSANSVIKGVASTKRKSLLEKKK